MKPKLNTKLSHITLLPTLRRAVTFVKAKNRWFVRYLDNGKPSREGLTRGITEAEAMAEAERRYMELALAGAVKPPPKGSPIKRHPLDLKPVRDDPMRGIHRIEIKTVRYVIRLWGRSFGHRNTITEARAERDRLERIHAARPCPCCGGPVELLRVSKRRIHASHQGCDCAFESPPLGRLKALDAWNRHTTEWLRANPGKAKPPNPREANRRVRKTQGRAASRAKERERENAEYMEFYGVPVTEKI